MVFLRRAIERDRVDSGVLRIAIIALYGELPSKVEFDDVDCEWQHYVVEIPQFRIESSSWRLSPCS